MALSATRSSYLRPLLAFVLVVAILIVAKTVIVPLALAILLTFVLAPVVSVIQLRGVPRVPAVLLTAILAFVLIGLIGCIVGLQVNKLAGELPTHRKEIDAKVASLRGDGEGTFAKLLQMLREIGKGKTEAPATAEGRTPQEKIVVAQPPEPSSLEQLANAVGPALEPLGQAALIVVLVIFMLIKREDLRNRFIGLLGHGRLTGTTRVLVDSAQRLSRFLLTQLLINLGFGVLFAFGLFFADVPYAFLWGFLAVVLRFVPFIGSLVAVAFPLVLAFAIDPGWTQPIIVLALFAVLELLTANVVEPLLVGHGTGVSSIALLVAAAFWTWVWGPIGLVLSTPLTVCLVVLGQHIPRLRVFALLLGDKPALAPHVSFYQRLLARDQQEAKQVVKEQARLSGQENVYDEVLLPALALARRDRKHASLSADDEAFIFRAMKDILETCSENAPTVSHGAGPPPVVVEGKIETSPVDVLVVGCPAHHEAEELSLAMLSHLLKPDGCRVEIVSTKALPAEIEARVEREAPALVFVAVLPPGGLVQARYLCKRLRKRFAELPIVVGFWGGDRHYDEVLVRLRSAGANYVTTSLLQSRSQLLAASRAQAGALASAAPPGSADTRPWPAFSHSGEQEART
jgi:predicted PurR-regulated permease PerM/CheY-like chemotaxis protein